MGKSHFASSGATGSRVETVTVPGWDGWGDMAPTQTWSIERARAEGYQTARDYAKTSGMSAASAGNKLFDLYEAGALERVRLRTRAYAYRPKKEKP